MKHSSTRYRIPYLSGILALLLAVLTLVSLSADAAQLASAAKKDKKKDKKTVTVATDTLPHNDRRRYDYFFLEAVRQQAAGHYDAAFELFCHCLSIDPAAAETHYALAAYYSEMNRDSTALLSLERAASLSPGNDTYQERVAQYYIGTKNYDKAIAAYENLYAHHRDRSDVLSILCQLYRAKKDYTQWLSTLDRMEQIDGANDELSITRMSVYEMMGETDKACDALRRLVDIHPNEPSYKVMLGNWLVQHERGSEAYPYFSDALADDPNNEFAQNSLYDYYRSTGQDSAAVALRDRILFSPKAESKTKLSLLQQIIQESEKAGGDSTQVLALFDSLMVSPVRSSDMAILRAAYMQLKKMPEDTVKQAFYDVLTISPDNAEARIELIMMLWDKHEWDEIITICQSGVQYTPEDMRFYYFLGLSYYNKDDHDRALDALQRGVGEINESSNHDIVSDFYSIMGDILYRKGQTDAAYEAYDNCLKWKADNVMCLNNYAYFLSEHHRELEKAEQMSQKAVKAEPGNATYLDTYAWILFLRGNNAYALKYIDQAMEADTDSVPSAVILEHGGDIHAVCGDTDKAVELWQRALDAGGENKAMLNKKIRQRKYIENKK